MALTTSLYVKAQNKLLGAMGGADMLFREPVVHKLFSENTQFMSPSFAESKKARERVVELNYLQRVVGANGGAPTHNHTGTQTNTGVITPAFAPVSRPMVSYKKEADNSIYTMEELHQHKIENEIINLSEVNEGLASAYLFANRSGTNVATSDGVFDAVDDTFEISEALLGEDAIEITKMVMDVNSYSGNYDIVCDSIAFRKFTKLANQGTMNAANTAYQFTPNIRFLHDATLTTKASGLVSAYSRGYWIVVPKGTIGLLDYIPDINRLGEVTSVNMYGQLISPIDEVNYALHSYETRADGTGSGGSVQDVKIETQIWADLAYVHAPKTTAGDSTLMAFALIA